MFEDYTYERLLEDVLNNAPEGIDTRQGSIFYDAVSGPVMKIAKLYTDLDLIVEMTSIATAQDEALDARASEYGMTRRAATKAKYNVAFEGVTPQIGERFYTDGQYFVLKEDIEKGVYYLEAELAGSSGNEVYSGTPAVPVNSIEGLTEATFGSLYESGSDDEADDDFRTRVQEKIAGPAENGNKQHYKTWCESRDGVGRARIFPLWNGPNTVKGVLIDTEGTPCSPPKVAEVQNYIDPATKGYTATVGGKTYVVGDGLGEGVANLGAHFTAVAASPLEIAVAFEGELASGATKEAAEQEAAEAISDYLKELVLTTVEATDIVVRVSAIGAILSSLQNLLDYSNLRLNGDTHNIIPGEDDVPIVGEVVIE
nr:MAG: baseplate J-like protein [Bacteriophage sp.]